MSKGKMLTKQKKKCIMDSVRMIRTRKTHFMTGETERLMDFIIKGDFAYCKNQTELIAEKDAFLICINGRSEGIFREIPEKYKDLELYDYSGKLIIPGMTDLHIHAPQYAFRGMHMDEELLEWLNRYTFVEEGKYADEEYARLAYGIFAEEMRKSATTRASVFATVHRRATVILMDEMERSGLVSYIGKINMDRNAPETILDESADMSAYNTFGWINETAGKYGRTMPILTPRFIPSCSNELLGELKEIVHTYDIPIQSHLSENPGEVSWVKELMPDSEFYGDGYARFDLFGKHTRTIMAHCIYSPEKEIELMKENGVYVAHCPSSNMNLCSGIAPIRKYLDRGIRVGLGSDVAAGESESIFTEIKKAIEVSKLYQRYIDASAKPLTFPEAFWLATLSGASFFGKAGSFAKDYEFDAVVLDDEKEAHPQPLEIPERLERSIYLGTDRDRILAKFVRGTKIL